MAVDRDLDFKFEKLTADNYHTWKFNMKMFLIGKDLWDIVNGSEILDEKRKFKKRDNMALASVCLSVSSNLQIYVRSAETGKEAWDCLTKHPAKDAFEKNSSKTKAVLGKIGKRWRNYRAYQQCKNNCRTFGSYRGSYR